MPTKKETLTLICDTAARLAVAADHTGESTLAHILRMAALEADDALAEPLAARSRSFPMGIRPH